MAEGERASTVERRRGRDGFSAGSLTATNHMPAARHIYRKNNAFQHKAAAMF